MKKSRIINIFLTIAFLNSPIGLYAQDTLNLSFEKIDHITHSFERWNMDMGTTGSMNYIAGIDSTTKEQGRYSLFIEKDLANTNGIVGSCINHFLVNFRAKEIEFTGFIKTQDVSKLASVIIQITATNGRFSGKFFPTDIGIPVWLRMSPGSCNRIRIKRWFFGRIICILEI